jgi:hypothetical protein
VNGSQVKGGQANGPCHTPPMARALALLFLTTISGCYASHDPLGDGGVSVVTSACVDGSGGSRRDCGFRIERTEFCRPGFEQTVGCGCAGLGSCDGDPVLRICAGNAACTVEESLDNVDDRCGLCPSSTFSCPPEGRYTILTAPYGVGGSYACRVEARSGG